MNDAINLENATFEPCIECQDSSAPRPLCVPCLRNQDVITALLHHIEQTGEMQRQTLFELAIAERALIEVANLGVVFHESQIPHIKERAQRKVNWHGIAKLKNDFDLEHTAWALFDLIDHLDKAANDADCVSIRTDFTDKDRTHISIEWNPKS